MLSPFPIVSGIYAVYVLVLCTIYGCKQPSPDVPEETEAESRYVLLANCESEVF